MPGSFSEMPAAICYQSRQKCLGLGALRKEWRGCMTWTPKVRSKMAPEHLQAARRAIVVHTFRSRECQHPEDSHPSQGHRRPAHIEVVQPDRCIRILFLRWPLMTRARVELSWAVWVGHRMCRVADRPTLSS